MMAEKFNYMQTYMARSTPQEAPDIFHLWCGLWSLSAAFGRNGYLDRDEYFLFPNLYVLLVAGSSGCRKSTACNMASDILRKMTSRAMFSPAKVTPEQLTKLLSQVDGPAECIIHADELAVFLGRDSNAKGMVDMLTTTFGCPREWEASTIGRGGEPLNDVCFNMLGAFVIKNMNKTIPQAAEASGFIARCVLVYSNDTAKIKARNRDKAIKNAQEIQLADHLNKVRKLSGEFQFDPEADDYWYAWYEKFRGSLDSKRQDGYYGRKHDLILKVGMLLSLSRGDMTIDLIDIKQSFDIVNQMESFMPNVMKQFSVDDTGRTLEDVLVYIQQAGCAKLRNIQNYFFRRVRAKELTEMLSTLEISGLVERSAAGSSIVYSYKGKSYGNVGENKGTNISFIR